MITASEINTRFNALIVSNRNKIQNGEEIFIQCPLCEEGGWWSKTDSNNKFPKGNETLKGLEQGKFKPSTKLYNLCLAQRIEWLDWLKVKVGETIFLSGEDTALIEFVNSVLNDGGITCIDEASQLSHLWELVENECKPFETEYVIRFVLPPQYLWGQARVINGAIEALTPQRKPAHYQAEIDTELEALRRVGVSFFDVSIEETN